MRALTSSAVALAAGGLIVTALAPPARADLWEDRTASCIGTTAEWSNKVELADVDGDGWVDIVFANGGNYADPGPLEASRVFRNRQDWPGSGGLRFEEITTGVFGDVRGHTRVVKVRDVDGDGKPDIFVGNTYEIQSRLFLGQGGGAFTDATATNLPQQVGSFGDAEFGDVDGDGDLDLVLADWGAGDPFGNAGGRTRLWLNSGDGHFTDATAAQMPDVLVGMSWDLELFDYDDDFDLDIGVTCKLCSGSYLFRNDGTGRFTDDPDALPQYGNNYEFEPMDVDGDGDLDLVTLNDGDNLRDHLFINQGGRYTDETPSHWPDSQNTEDDDNMAAFLDADSDGDADFVIGSLSGFDRLLRNDGQGNFTVETDVMQIDTFGTLGLQVADLDHDRRLDVVQAQGESAFPDKVLLAVDLPPDTAAPHVGPVRAFAGGTTSADDRVVRARVHDRKSPSQPTDWTSVLVRWQLEGGAADEAAMTWYGEYLWSAALPAAPGSYTYRVCATDAAGNETCSADQQVTVIPGGGADAGPGQPDGGSQSDAGIGPTPEEDGCGCRTCDSGGTAGMFLLGAMVFTLACIRRRPRAR